MKKILPWLILIVFVVFSGGALLTVISQFTKSTEYETPLVIFLKTEKEKTIKVVLVGDIMLDRGVEYMIEKEGKGDFRFPFLKIADYLKGADIVFGNLEGPISDKGVKVGSIYSFRNDPKTIEGLTYAGFNLISLANNHAFDYGRTALEDTLLRLKDYNPPATLPLAEGERAPAGVDEHSFISTHRSARVIDYVGAGFNENEAYSPIIKEVKDIRVGFLAYTNLGPETWRAVEENSGIAWISENDFEKTKEDVKSAKEKADILIVSLHAGEEYVSKPTQFQISFSKAAIDAGADLVVGHHPHVIQKSEKYQNGWIFYSLGNFVFDQSFSEETMRGQILEILIEDGKIKELIPKEIKLNNYFQPAIKDEPR